MNRYKQLLIDLVISIKENEMEVEGRKSFAEDSESDYITAKAQVYREVMEVIRMLAREQQVQGELGL